MTSADVKMTHLEAWLGLVRQDLFIGKIDYIFLRDHVPSRNQQEEHFLSFLEKLFIILGRISFPLS